MRRLERTAAVHQPAPRAFGRTAEALVPGEVCGVEFALKGGGPVARLVLVSCHRMGGIEKFGTRSTSRWWVGLGTNIGCVRLDSPSLQPLLGNPLLDHEEPQYGIHGQHGKHQSEDGMISTMGIDDAAKQRPNNRSYAHRDADDPDCLADTCLANGVSKKCQAHDP